MMPQAVVAHHVGAKPRASVSTSENWLKNAADLGGETQALSIKRVLLLVDPVAEANATASRRSREAEEGATQAQRRLLEELDLGDPKDSVLACVHATLAHGCSRSTALRRVEEVRRLFRFSAVVAREVFDDAGETEHWRIDGIAVAGRRADLPETEEAAAYVFAEPEASGLVLRALGGLNVLSALDDDAVFAFRARTYDKLRRSARYVWEAACNYAPPEEHVDGQLVGAFMVVDDELRPLIGSARPRAKPATAAATGKRHVALLAKKAALAERRKVTSLAVCGNTRCKKLVRIAKTGRPRKFCCARCRLAAWRIEARKEKHTPIDIEVEFTVGVARVEGATVARHPEDLDDDDDTTDEAVAPTENAKHEERAIMEDGVHEVGRDPREVRPRDPALPRDRHGSPLREAPAPAGDSTRGDRRPGSLGPSPQRGVLRVVRSTGRETRGP